MAWTQKISAGMALIVEGCKENPDWRQCKFCPFDVMCTSIWADRYHDFSTPDNWDEERKENKT